MKSSGGRTKDKVCLVTGANSGLGKATAHVLARMGATLILACRDKERGEAARAEIVAQMGNSAVELMLVDFVAQKSVRQMAAALGEKHNRSNHGSFPDGCRALVSSRSS